MAESAETLHNTPPPTEEDKSAPAPSQEPSEKGPPGGPSTEGIPSGAGPPGGGPPGGGPPGGGPPGGPANYPTGAKLYSIIGALYLAGFLTALDRTIVTTAIPTITDEFGSIGDVGWYGSAYLLTFCAFQLLFGKIYSFYSPKWVFLTAVFIFEVGSAICAGAPNSVTLIVGRAIAGLGSSGIFGGSVIITFNTVPLQKRPIYTGIVSVVFAVASIVGPLLGGALTQHATWRWCFLINLPVGAVTIFIIALVLKLPPARAAGTPFKEQLKQTDPLGTLAFVPGIISLLLALQWGGSTYAWGDARVIALLVLSGVLIIAFGAIQVLKKDTATLPLRVLKQRTVAAAVVFTVFVSASFILLIYFLPIWFQAIKGADAVQSGVMMLPLVIASAVAGLGSGFAISKIGYYTPFMIFGSVLMSIGAGLITTFMPDTWTGRWIGFQILWGFGCGMGMQALSFPSATLKIDIPTTGMQQGSLAAQTVLPFKDVPIGISLVFFAQSLGGSIFLSVGQNVFSNKLVQGLTGLPQVDAGVVADTGATDLRKVVGPDALDALLAVYNAALQNVFYVALAAACASAVAAFAIEWKSVKKVKKGGPPGAGGPPGGGPPGKLAGPPAKQEA